MSSTSTRKPKWHPTPPPPPTPSILNLPKPSRKKHVKQVKKLTTREPMCEKDYRGKLEVLFGQEREFEFSKSMSVSVGVGVPIVLLSSGERRERVEEERERGRGRGSGFEEEKWRFQAEVLRAECNFLRMERELALKKLDRNRVQMERTLRLAVQTLVSGREKIYQGKNVSVVLEEEIEDLAEKLEDLMRSSGIRGGFEVPKCSNFDRKASLLQRRLEKLGGLSDEKCASESTLSINVSCHIDKESSVLGCKSSNKSIPDNVQLEMVRSKMVGFSKDMLDRMEDEFRSVLSTPANSSVGSSASTSKRIEFPDSSYFSIRQPYREENKCSGVCKAFVRKIVEQVRAETEQWSQMQDMVGQVRAEMEELQASKDFWEDRALDSDYENQYLQSSLQDWRERALTFEAKANELETEMAVIKEQLEKLRIQQAQECTPISLGRQLEMEKRVLICRVKENSVTTNEKRETCSDGRRKTVTNSSRSDGTVALKRSPFRDIGNSMAGL